jgi:hypothetical protein
MMENKIPLYNIPDDLFDKLDDSEKNNEFIALKSKNLHRPSVDAGFLISYS